MASQSPSSETASVVPLTNQQRFPELYREGPIANRHNATRVVPMRVLVFGLMRTGTASTQLALSHMGFDHVYHMTSVFQDPDDAQWWSRATDAKWNNKGKGFTREDWDKLLGHCQAVCDIPPAAFAEELVAAYPEAKVVILNRDVDKWYQSMEQTLLRFSKPTPWLMFLGLIDWTRSGQISKMLGLMMQAMFGPGDLSAPHLKKFFVEYHDKIRRIVPKDRLLEYKVQDGYRPLCDFLGVPIPTTMVGEKEVEEPFPKVNDSATFNERVALAKSLSRQRAYKKMATFISVSAVVGVGAWYLGGR